MKDINPIAKGVAVGFFLSAIGMVGFSPEWWVAMLSLTVAVNL